MKHRDRHVLSHAGIYLLARGFPGLMAFLAIPLFTRLLEPEQYGHYALTIASVNVLGAMLFQWTRLALVRFLPSCRHDPMRLKNTLLGSTLGLAVVSGVAFAVAGFLPIDETWRSVLLACWIMLVIQAMYELSCEYARAALRPWRYMVLQLFRSGIGLGVGVLLVWFGWGWYGPLLGLAVGMGLGVLYSRGDWRGARPSIDRAMLVKLSGYGVPVSLTVAMVCLMGSCDRFLIALLMGADAAGHYAVAVDLASQTAGMLMLVVYMPLFPLAVHAWEEQGRRAAQATMRSNAALQLAIGLPSVAGLAVLAPGIVHCFLGDDFRAAATPLVPLAAVAAFLAGMKAFHFDAAFQFAHKTLQQTCIVLAAAVVNIVLNLAMIPRWGLPGAAVASIASYGLALGMSLGFGRRHVRLPIPAADTLRVVLATAVMSAALWPFRHSVSPLALGWQILGGAGIYAAILAATNFMDLRVALFSRLGFGTTSTSPTDDRARSTATADARTTVPVTAAAGAAGAAAAAGALVETQAP